MMERVSSYLPTISLSALRRLSREVKCYAARIVSRGASSRCPLPLGRERGDVVVRNDSSRRGWPHLGRGSETRLPPFQS